MNAQRVRRAVAAALGVLPHDVEVIEESRVRVRSQEWTVRTSAFEGLQERGCPEVLIVAPTRVDTGIRATWVAELPGRGFASLKADGVLAELFGACSRLPAETIARLVAYTRGNGGEAVVVREEELEVVLGAQSSALPVDQRLPRLQRHHNGWTLDFVSYRTYPAEGALHVSVTAWQASFERGNLSTARTELVSSAPFPPRR